MKKPKFNLNKKGNLEKLLDVFNFNRKKNIKEIEKLYNEPILFKSKHFHQGSIIYMNHYNAKNKSVNILYNETPLIMILGENTKYILGWSISHTPIKYRKIILKYVKSKNKSRLKKDSNTKLNIDYKTIKKVTSNLKPVIRLYIKNRISNRGIYFPTILFDEVMEVKSENFIGLTAEDAWKLAVNSFNN